MFLIYTVLTIILLAAILYGLGKLFSRRTCSFGLSEPRGSQYPTPESADKGTTAQTAAEPSKDLRFWVHAVSAGEVMGAVPLVKGLQARFPGARIILSTLTPTGSQVARQHCGDIEVALYRHVDFFLTAKSIIAQIRPTIFLPVEADLWPSLIHRLSRRGVPCVLVNGRISPRRLRYRFLFKSVFRQIDFFGVQAEVDAERLAQLGVSRSKIAVTGNTKFSQAARSTVGATPKSIPLPDGGHLLIGGSTHEDEEAELLRCYAGLAARRKNIFLLLAPRHLERLERVESLVRAQGFASVRWSEMDSETRAPIIILDTMGQLPQIYGQATAVFVGGSWVKRGGHNVLEPAAWGKPIFFGPHMENFSSIAAALVTSGAAAEVADGEELAKRIGELLEHPEELAKMGQAAKTLVANNQDAVKRTLEIVESVLAATQNLNRDPAGLSQATDSSFAARLHP